MSKTNGRTHEYHAEATVLEGHLRLPLAQEIKRQAHVKLPDYGGYLAQRGQNYHLESVISFRSAYTQVAGNLDVKPDKGWSTLATSVVEGLNVLDVLTADRVVGQMTTEHPLKGYVPSISFLGTRFENLRIAGHPVELDMALDIVGPRPDDDLSYTADPGFLCRVAEQCATGRQSPNLQQDVEQDYNRLAPTPGNPAEVECSLVNRASGGYPGLSFGHIIHIPHFGWITLAKLRLTYEDIQQGDDVHRTTTFHLTMIDLKLGCPIEGGTEVGTLSTNGKSKP
jgi:hypothetical protein